MRSPSVRPVALTTALLASMVLLPCAATAQFSGADTLYAGGALGFTYRQTPIPIYSGVFAAEGDALLPDGSLPPGQTEAVGGGMGMVTPDSVATAIYAIKDNGNDTYDVGLAVLRTFGPLQPGAYPINVQTGAALFIFIDDAASVALPDTLDAATIIQWFQDLPAAHKFVSLTGSISVSTVSADTLAGTFTGSAADIDNVLLIVNVTAGHFALRGLDPMLATPDLPPAAPAALSVAPNPFNPRTSLAFTLPRAQHLEAAVYDVTGRRVRVLHDGVVGAGPQRLEWDGGNDDGVRMGAGVYLARIRGDGWQRSAKLTLLP
jgi:hypothetical protein